MKNDFLHHLQLDGTTFGFGNFLSGDNTFNFDFLPSADVPAKTALQGQLTQNTSTSLSNNLVGSTSTVPYVDSHWDGITFAQSGGYYPPDNGFAVGAAVAIAAENSALQFTTLTGGSPLTESLNTFFSSVLSSGYFLSDPRVLYDTSTHQFVVSVDEVSNTLNASKILLAVSNTDLSAPSLSASNWQFESQSTTYNINGNITWADQPLVSIDGHDIYVSTNQFTASGSYVASAVSIFNDGLYSPGGTSNLISATAYSSPSYQPAAIAGGGEYLVSDTHNSLSIFESLPNSTGGVTLSNAVSVSLGTIDFGNGSYAANQYGTRFKLDAGDGRITSAAYDSADQKLYVVFEGVPNKLTGTPSVEWAQLDMSNFNASGGTQAPTVLHTGNLNSLLPTTGATAGAATFNGSLAVDANGDVLFNFNVSGSHMYAADYFVFWKGAGSATSSTAPNFSAPIDYHDSVAAYIDPAHDAVGRWGDYSTAIADPNAANHNAFYVSNEFDNGTLSHYSSWATSVAHVLLA